MCVLNCTTNNNNSGIIFGGFRVRVSTWRKVKLGCGCVATAAAGC